MRVKARVFIYFLSGFAICKAKAQHKAPDSLLYSSAAGNVIAYFNKTVTDRSEIYNGRQYELYPPANKGSFYFLDKNHSVPALIRYNGTWYKNVPILYDVHNDEMIANAGDNLFVLHRNKISDVYLLDHHFINLEAPASSNLTAGFYDLLYNGKSKVLVKRIKTIDDHTAGSTQTVEVFYLDKITVYVKKGDNYLPVSSRGDFLEIFKDRKKELKQYIKDNKLDFATGIEDAVAKLASYYDTISK